jgi:hypothetical protein
VFVPPLFKAKVPVVILFAANESNLPIAPPPSAVHAASFEVAPVPPYLIDKLPDVILDASILGISAGSKLSFVARDFKPKADLHASGASTLTVLVQFPLSSVFCTPKFM